MEINKKTNRLKGHRLLKGKQSKKKDKNKTKIK